MLNRFTARLRKFRDDIQGAMLIYFVIVFTTMIALAGVAIDIARYEADRSQVQAHLDNATLAAASLRQSVSTPPADIVADYMDKAGMSDHYVVVTDAEKTINSITYRRVEASASADVNTMFMDMFGVDKLGIKVNSVAEERIPHVEISLILDVSGSMSGSKLANMKTGAKEFIDAVMAANTSEDPFRISVNLVPYNMQVNGGADLWAALDGPSVHSHSYCAEWNYSAFSTMDFSETQLTQAMPMSYRESDYWDYFSDDWWTAVPSGNLDYTRKGLYGSSWDYTYGYMPASAENGAHVLQSFYCRPDEWAQVLPMNANGDILKAAIDKFEARGNTSIDIAMKWGAALINPNHRDDLAELMALWPTEDDGWTGSVACQVSNGNKHCTDEAGQVVDVPRQAINPGFVGRPVNYGDDHTMKVVVLMTDGQNTTEYRVKSSYRGSSSPRWQRATGTLAGYLDLYRSHGGDENWDRLTWAEYWERVGVYTHYKRVGGGGWSTYWDASLGNTAKNTRLSNICSKVRDPDGDGEDEVTIFTIAFSAPSNGRAAMKDCATSPHSPHYFAADNDTIVDVFRQIGGVIEKLKLVQ